MNLNLGSLINEGEIARVPALFQKSPDDFPERWRAKQLLRFLLVLVGAGALAGIWSLIVGHHSHGTYSEMPWGVLIATYEFFVVSSVGLCLVSSLGHVFGFKLFEPLAKRAVFFALLTLLIAFSVIATELDRPFRLALLAVISPNLSAPIWWMGALYAVYMVLIAVGLYFLIREEHARARLLGLLSVVAGLAALSNMGSVFGLNHARPVWYGPFLPIYFVVSALVSGSSILLLIALLSDYFGNQKSMREETGPLMEALGKLLALFLGILMFITVWKIITALHGHHHHKAEVMQAILFGKLSISFWVFEVFVGMLIPFALLLRSRPENRAANFALAAGLVMVGAFFMRYNLVFSGQMFSLRPLIGDLGERITYSPLYKGNAQGFLEYTPSIVEILIVTGAISAAVIGYIAGSRILRLQNNPSVAAGRED